MIWKSAQLIAAILLIFNIGYSQESDLKFEHIGREQGLTANSVLSILQDRQGFMWFGTMDGLFRYDGYGMNAYKYEYKDADGDGQNDNLEGKQVKENKEYLYKKGYGYGYGFTDEDGDGGCDGDGGG